MPGTPKAITMYRTALFLFLLISLCVSSRTQASELRAIELKISKDTIYTASNRDRSPALIEIFGRYDGGRRATLPLAQVDIEIKTLEASGGVTVARREGRKLYGVEGGTALVTARIGNLTSQRQIVVSPFYRDYHQTLVLKLFLGMEGTPVPRLAGDPLFQRPHDVLCTFERALDTIKRTDNLTAGIPKIVYLVGWQKGGHDHGYPDWSEVNPRLKRPQDTTALQSLRWLIREGRKYHTTVSLHINMVDAYRASPLFAEYAAKDCLARDAAGNLYSPGIQMQGEEMYNVVYPKEWEAGLAQRRIDKLIAMIPELRLGHTIHIDVFIAQRENGDALSLWHARPENGGLTPAKYVETQRKIFHYWRDRGFDVTGEGIFWAHPPGEGFTGLQAHSWWYPGDPGYEMRVPERLMARGRTDRGSDGDYRFGASMHGEEIFKQDLKRLPGFLQMFCRTTLPWQYLSHFERIGFANETLTYEGGVVAGPEDGDRVIRHGNFILRRDDDLFVPALWSKMPAIIAYSQKGYTNRSWMLPVSWAEVGAVDLYRITMDGKKLRSRGLKVEYGEIHLNLLPEEAVWIVPANEAEEGADPWNLPSRGI